MGEGIDFRLSGIGFLLLGVSDLKRSLAFYSETLGLRSKSQIPGFAFLDAGALTLVLSEPLGRALGSLPGAMEIVCPVADVREAYQTLRQRGVAFLAEPRNVTGSDWSAVFTDPDGHRLSIFGPGGRTPAGA
jgi:catechol 2,3-dioxygenase-like lactoylglutathione lyase family enzyme